MELLELPPSKVRFIDSWFLLGSPVSLIAIFSLYFCFLSIGPKFMENRKPFNLTKIIRVYNLIQIASCTFFAVIAYRLEYYVFSSTWKCMEFSDHPLFPNRMGEVFTLYWYFMILRTAELIETVFFVLRKKQKQVSFLHVYHHVSTIIFLYIFIRYSATIMELYIAVLNNCVHIPMYVYYFASSFPSAKNFVQKLKPIMTTIQITQLVLIFGQCLVARACGSSNLFYVFAINFIVLISFFLNFFIKNYIINNKSGGVKKVQ